MITGPAGPAESEDRDGPTLLPGPGSGLRSPAAEPDPDGATVISALRQTGVDVTEVVLGSRRGAGARDTTIPARRETVQITSDRLGRYSVEGMLGAGGMGAVLRLHDPDLCRDLAAKVIRGGADEVAESQLARFVNEAQITGQLEHPNIIPVHELCLADGGNLFYTMKQVQGDDLQKVLLDASTSGEDQLIELLEIFLKVCDALAFAHEKGVIHRDLKPANIMVGKFGEVLLMDWGLAKLVGAESTEKPVSSDSQVFNIPTQETLSGAVMGTPAYMPPEQAKGQTQVVGRLSDLYSMGAILYEILTYEVPFDGTTLSEVLDRVKKGDLVPPSERCPDRQVPRELEAVVLKAMATRPADRYQSILALRQEITRFLQGGTLTAATYNPMQLLGKWAKRHRKPLLAAGLATLLVLGLGGWGQKISQQRRVGQLLTQGREQLAQAPGEAERTSFRLLELAPESEQAKELLRSAAVAANRLRQQQGLKKQILEQQQVLAKASQQARQAPAVDPATRRAWYRAHRAELNAAKALYRLQSSAEVGRQVVAAALALAHQLTTDESWEMAHQMVEEAAAAGLEAEAAGRERRRVETRRTALVKSQTAQAREIIEAVRGAPPEAGMFQEYLTRLVRLPHPHVVRLLIPELLAQQERLRLLACEALGRIGDRTTTARVPRSAFPRTLPVEAWREEEWCGMFEQEYQTSIAKWVPASGEALVELDAVQVLVLRLAVCSVYGSSEAVIQLTWALCRLRDRRSWMTVFIKREAAGRVSIMFERTINCVRWLPIPKGPGGEDEQLWRGFIELARSNHDKAVAHFTALLKRDPGHLRGLANRGIGLQRLGDLQGALRDLNRALELSPHHSVARLNRSYVFVGLKRYDRALADLNALLKKDPRNLMARNNRGRVWQEMGEWQRAMADFEKVIEQSPQMMIARYNRIVLFFHYGKYYLAKKACDEALELAGDDDRILAARAESWLGLKSYQWAVADCSRVLRRNPRFSAAYIVRAKARFHLGELAGALSDLDLAIGLEPKDAEAYCVRADFLIQKKRYREALAGFERAIAAEPDAPMIYRFRARLWSIRGQSTKALADIDKAYALAPKSALVLIDRATLRYVNHDLKGAIKMLEALARQPLPPGNPHLVRGERMLRTYKNQLMLESLRPK